MRYGLFVGAWAFPILGLVLGCSLGVDDGGFGSGASAVTAGDGGTTVGSAGTADGGTGADADGDASGTSADGTAGDTTGMSTGDDGGTTGGGGDTTASTTGASATTGGDTSTTAGTMECGDGVMDPGEECDDGNMVDTDACTAMCQDAECGDGSLYMGMEDCDDGNTDPWDGCSDICATEPTVDPLYPTNGADWNDYIKNDGTGPFDAGDVACAGTETGGYSACLHAGEIRMATVEGQNSCGSLTAVETLDAFVWECDDSGGTAVFRTAGLQEGRYLSDLVDFDTSEWIPNGLRIMDGATEVFRTADTAWWGNPVEVNDAGGDLTVAGTIVLVSSNPSATYDIEADRIGFVVRPGVVMQGTASSSEDLIQINSGRSFLWVEGEFDGANDTRVIDASSNMVFSVIRGFRSVGADDAIYTNSARNCLFREVYAGGTGDYGIQMAGIPVGNTLLHVSTIGCGNRGLYFASSAADNVVVDLVSADNEDRGVMFAGSAADNRVAAAIVTNNGNDGLYFGSSGGGNAVIGVTVVNNADDGVVVTSSCTRNTFSSVVVANNTNHGIRFGTSSANNVIADLASVHNDNDGIQISSSANNSYYTGVLKVGDNANEDCDVSGTATNPGVSDGTCTANGSSDFSFTGGASVASSFVGKVTTTDGTNSSNTNGTQSLGAITDWIDFDRRARAWGADGGVFPAVNHQDYCISGTCRIWDWSLVSGDGVLRSVASPPTGNDTLPHDNGAQIALRNAYEVADDDIGDEDGLCESDEVCIMVPNIGGYAGHGALADGGFTPGTLTGITLLTHPNNGY